MPTYTETTKPDVIYNELSDKGWFIALWFCSPWFGSGKGFPSYDEPTKSTPTYTEPAKGA